MAEEEDKAKFSVIVSSSATANNLLIEYAARHALGIPPAVRIIQTERPSADNPIFSLVGRVAAAWAHLEHVLDQIIWELADVEQAEGACITAQIMGATPRYRTLMAQLTLAAKTKPRLANFVGKIEGLMQRSYEPQERRNRIVHDPWYVKFEAGPGLLTRPLSERPAQFRSMPHKNPTFGIEEIDQVEIEKTIADIESLSERAQVLGKEIIAALAASR